MAGPVRRKRETTGTSSGVKKRGEGLGTGSVGNNSAGAQHASGKRPSLFGFGSSRPQSDYSQANQDHERDQSRNVSRAGGLGGLLGGKGLLAIVAVVVIYFVLGKGGGLGNLFGGGDSAASDMLSGLTGNVTDTSYGSSVASGSSISDILSMLMGGGSTSGSSSVSEAYNSSLYETNWSGSGTSTGNGLDTSVATGVPAKRTLIYGDSRDTVNLMIYMCGTDLESRSGAATSDLQEMLAAEVGENINLIIYTGGCTKWNNNVISSKVNQIYQVKGGKLYSLNENAGSASMTNPDTLSGFVKWVAANFPANRNMLIFWDHGGGSVSGYGYDEKYKNSGSMSLAGIDTALKNSGVTFDLVGFDACLMATVETALMLSDYADYMIGSEEVEPGIGWYYTTWLTALSKNPSMSTLELGKSIADSFTQKASSVSYGTGTTLSLIDLAEAGYTIPDKLTAFSSSTINMIAAGSSSDTNYKTVANARANAKEFGSSTRIDQVDFVDLANKIGTTEAKELAAALKSAVKYNVTSGSMSNAYGLAVYFPYRKASYVDAATKVYSTIGMPAKYSECIRKFAQTEVGGQAAAGGTGSALGSLFGSIGGSSSDYTSGGISDLLGGLLGGGGDFGSLLGLDRSNTEFIQDMDVNAVAEYVAENHFDESRLVWTKNEAGDPCIALSLEDWQQLTDVKLSMFYNDGEGFIDLGLDAYFEFDKDGNLLPVETSWLAINGQTVAFYQDYSVGTEEDYVITGHVPVLYNGQLAELVIVFTPENESGVVAGVRFNYKDEESAKDVEEADKPLYAVAKVATVQTTGDAEDLTAECFDAAGNPMDAFAAQEKLTALQNGDTIDFIADYYTYDGDYQDTYMIGDQIKVDGPLSITNLELKKEDVRLMYRLTDLYNRDYWTEIMP